MANYTVQSVGQSGLNPNYVAVSASDTFDNDGRTMLHVKNGGGSAVTVTVNAEKPCNQGFLHNVVVSVPAGAERMIGPFDKAFYVNESTGKATVTYSATATVTVAAIKF
jgi:hypothetical protein